MHIILAIPSLQRISWPDERSQEPATGPYPDSDASSPQLCILLKIKSNIILPSTRNSSKWSLPFS